MNKTSKNHVKLLAKDGCIIEICKEKQIKNTYVQAHLFTFT